MLRVVALLERVQGGIIGQTLSSFGITGLYITFVFGIGRFLRFSTQHARMRIPFEDLPTTKRLIALCQVQCHPEFRAPHIQVTSPSRLAECSVGLMQHTCPHGSAHCTRLRGFQSYVPRMCLWARCMLLLLYNRVLFASSKPSLGLD